MSITNLLKLKYQMQAEIDISLLFMAILTNAFSDWDYIQNE